MKKHFSKKRLFLKILVALTVLSSILVSSLLGVTKAEYFKSMSKKFDVELKPDLRLEYLIYDAPVYSGNASYELETGVYKDSKNFVQPVIIGTNNNITIDTNTVPYGGGVAYKIKIPVSETGYYSLDFQTYMRAGLSGYERTEFFTVNIAYAVGCQVINAASSARGVGTKFDSTPFEIAYRQYESNTGRGAYETYTTDKGIDVKGEPMLFSDTAVLGKYAPYNESTYLWKTTAPFHAENVKLTFKVEQADVDAGYVVWAWDLRGLEGRHNYRIFVEDLSIEKIMELDGTTKYRTQNDPYFMFPQTAYINNAIVPDGTSGKNRTANGRGTFVTEATTNSLGMRAEMLYSNNSTGVNNPLGIYIPLKNVNFDTTYKVTFDFSVARQGLDAADPTALNGYDDGKTPAKNWHEYSDFDKIFNVGTRPIQSYLHSGLDKSRTQEEHNVLKAQITYANKEYHGYPLTKYDEVYSKNSDLKFTTSTSVNDTFSSRYDSSGNNTINRNYFNAVRHTEYNGQNTINWLTFYNTTFSFNIPQAKNQGLDIDDLYWIWEIDATRYTAYYNIRIDNVRIEKVVDYASGLDNNGFKIGSTTISPTTHLDNAGQGRTEDDEHTAIDSTGRDINAFANYKGRNSTGQNFQARMHNTDMLMVKGNIYAPIVDARRFQAKAATDPYKIFLDGWAVVEGGISKYVFSVDGGNTWQDMTFEGNSDTAQGGDSYGILREAEYGINQYVKGQTTQYNGTNWIEFDPVDAANGRFDNFTLYADLQAYATQANLDVIIAAVPMSDSTCRCEILRIINFNQIRNYMTFPFDFVSDIKVKNYEFSGEVTNLNAHRIVDESAHYTWQHAKAENVGFTKLKTVQLKNYINDKNELVSVAGPNETTGYARMGARSHAYEDIRTAFSGLPIKTNLSITGWAMVEGGVEAYYWSADHGKTWTLCTGNPKSDRTEPVSKQYKLLYYDGKPYDGDNDNDKKFLQKHCFRDSIDGKFTGASADKKSGDMLTANLSAYVGQCVDVIFAAKPVGSDVYVPIGRCDNVGVYGENGLFWSRVGGVKLDGTEIAATTLDTDGKTLNMTTDRWSNLVATTNTNSQTIHPEDYSFYEPQNVNCVNSRLYNNKVNVMQSGGNVTLNGYIIAEKGIKRYKYSLDGGETWTIINHVVKNIRTDGWNGKHVKELISKTLNNDFSIAQDGVGGFYYLVDSYDDGPSMTFNLPALPDGAMRNLLVVAEGNADDNDDGEGNLYPILNIKLKFKYNDNISQYGYHYTPNKADLSTIQAGWQSEFNQDWEFVPTPSSTLGISNTFNRITIPVTEAGEHQLRFTHTLDNGPSETVTPEHYLYNDTKDSPNKVNNVHRTARITLSTTKTHYLVGEKIGLTFSCKFNNDTTSKGGFGTVTAAIISDDWLNESGRQYTLYSQRFAPGPVGSTAGTVSIDDITSAPDNTTHENSGVYSNTGMPKWALDLKAGKYSIVLIHRRPYYVNSKKENVSYGLADILETEELRQKYILAEVPIYIHDKDETVEFSVVHDEGEYTYFSNISEQFTSVGEKKNANADHIYTLTDPFSNDDVRAINATVNVTEGDVKRGYIVLDANYSNLISINEHTKEQCETEYGTDWGDPTNDDTDHTHNQCISRDANNGSLFTKQKLGDTLYDFTNLDDIPHGGFKYNVKMSLDDNALTRKLDQDTIDVIFAKAEQGYGNNVLMNTVTASGEHTVSYGSILNPPIKKGGINYDGNNTYSKASLSVPKTYFEVGEPITVDYNATGLTNNVWVYITSDQECTSGVYGDLFIKRAQVNVGATGIVKFTADTYDIGIGSYVNTIWKDKEDELNHLRTLPTGEYKIWFISGTNNFVPTAMFTPTWNKYMVTEPITIKVIDPAAPDLSMTCWSDRTYPNQTNNTTALTLNKVVYEQGEDIPFRISGVYDHVWVTVLKSDDFKGYLVDNITDKSDFSSYVNKNGTYSRYAEWGSSKHANDLSGGVLKTADGGVPLDPGQYKVVYLFGQCLQHAWQGKAFPDRHNGQAQKIMAIIDITIVPKNTLQKYSASYVKNDGSIGDIPLDIELSSIKDLVTTATNLNGSTFTVNTTPTTKNITINVPNDVDTSVVNNVALTIQTLPGTYSLSTYSSGKDNYSSTFFSANLGSGTAAIKLPVTQTGEYNLNFSAYLNTPTTIPVRGTAQIQSLVRDTDGEIVEVTQTAKPPTTITNPFNYYNVSGKFNVTAEDVARGYVLFEYSLTNLPTYSDFTFTMDNLTYTKNESQ